jgi:ribosomal-protein-alanine N-acetyltransferase
MREAAAGLGATRMYLEVRVSNEVAQTFYRARGFTVTGHRREYYSRPREDALTMAVDLTHGGT